MCVDNICATYGVPVITCPAVVVSGECYQQTKAVLHSALPTDALVGRVTESKVIAEFLDTHLSKMVPGSMYVSGAPGTGKTAVLMKNIEQLQVRICVLISKITLCVYNFICLCVGQHSAIINLHINIKAVDASIVFVVITMKF